MAKDKLPGGLADHEPASKYSKSERDKGVKVELEHTDDKTLSSEIAEDHLEEIPDYYTRLHKMESEAEKKARDVLEKFAQGYDRMKPGNFGPAGGAYGTPKPQPTSAQPPQQQNQWLNQLPENMVKNYQANVASGATTMNPQQAYQYYQQHYAQQQPQPQPTRSKAGIRPDLQVSRATMPKPIPGLVPKSQIKPWTGVPREFVQRYYANKRMGIGPRMDAMAATRYYHTNYGNLGKSLPARPPQPTSAEIVDDALAAGSRAYQQQHAQPQPGDMAKAGEDLTPFAKGFFANMRGKTEGQVKEAMDKAIERYPEIEEELKSGFEKVAGKGKAVGWGIGAFDDIARGAKNAWNWIKSAPKAGPTQLKSPGYGVMNVPKYGTMPSRMRDAGMWGNLGGAAGRGFLGGMTGGRMTDVGEEGGWDRFAGQVGGAMYGMGMRRMPTMGQTMGRRALTGMWAGDLAQGGANLGAGRFGMQTPGDWGQAGAWMGFGSPAIRGFRPGMMSQQGGQLARIFDQAVNKPWRALNPLTPNYTKNMASIFSGPGGKPHMGYRALGIAGLLGGPGAIVGGAAAEKMRGIAGQMDMAQNQEIGGELSQIFNERDQALMQQMGPAIADSKKRAALGDMAGAWSGISGFADTLISMFGMDPSSMSAGQKLSMILGGGLGIMGLMSGNTGMAMMGGLGAVLPMLLASQAGKQQPGGQQPGAQAAQQAAGAEGAVPGAAPQTPPGANQDPASILSQMKGQQELQDQLVQQLATGQITQEQAMAQGESYLRKQLTPLVMSGQMTMEQATAVGEQMKQNVTEQVLAAQKAQQASNMQM